MFNSRKYTGRYRTFGVAEHEPRAIDWLPVIIAVALAIAIAIATEAGYVVLPW